MADQSPAARPGRAAKATGLRALTVKQPWAWAIMHGKPVENRSWPVPGWRLDELAIHAGARSGWDEDGEDSPLVQVAWQRFIGPVATLNRWMGTRNVTLHRDNPLITFGVIVAVVEGVSCHHAADCRLPGLPGGCSPWAAASQYHWSWMALYVLPSPVPCGGHQKLWTVPEDAERSVRAQLSEEQANA